MSAQGQKRQNPFKEPTPPPKKLRSQPPDIIVAVGKGDDVQEFECYQFILCFASDYFDAMFSHPWKEKKKSRIELPEKDPEEWKMVYEFMDPFTSSNASVTKENALILAPWFHEYQMQNLLDKCDSFVSETQYFERFIEVDHFSFLHSSFWTNIVKTNLKNGIASAEKLFDYLSICQQLSLENSLDQALEEVGRFLFTGFDLLFLKKELTKKATEAFDNHKDYFEQNLTEDSLEFYVELTTHKSIGWENKIFQSLIEARLENIIMKRRIGPFDHLQWESDDDSDYCTEESKCESDDLFWECESELEDLD